MVNIFRKKAKQNAERFFLHLFPSGSIPPRRGTYEVIRNYRNLPWLFACATKIANSVASVQWEAFVAREEGKAVKTRVIGNTPEERVKHLRRKQFELEQLEEHPVLTLLDVGNEIMSGTFVMQLTQLWLDLAGEAFWIKEREGVAPVSGVWPIPPTWVIDVPTPGKQFFRVSLNTEQYEIPLEEIVWFRSPNPESPFARGVGYGYSLADELDSDEFASKHVKAWFYNRARPDLLIMPTEGQLSPSDTERVEQRWLEKAQGFFNAFKPFFLSRRVEVRELSQSFAEMQLIDLRRFERDTIIQVFGIPPELMGIIENSNRATIESADYLFSRWVLVPRLELIREVLQNQLVSEFDERIILDYVSPVAEDREYVLNVARSAPWALTVDEWREMMGLPPLPDGKGQVFMMPLNLYPQGIEGNGGEKGFVRKSARPLLNEQQQEKRWKAKVPTWDKHERSWIRSLKKYFQEQQDQVSENIRKKVKAVNVDDLLFEREAFNRKLDELAKPLYLEIIKDGAEEAAETIGFEHAFDVNNPKVQRWIGNRLKFIKDINETTRNELQEALREGISNGEGVSQLLDRVSEVFNRAKGWRAENIARTETISAFVEGNIELFAEAGVERLQFWTAMDERTCEDCLALHGKEYEISEASGVIPVHPSCRCDFVPIV